MKKLLLTLGTVAAVAVPVASVVACGSASEEGVKTGTGRVAFHEEGFKTTITWNSEVAGKKVPTTVVGHFSSKDPSKFTTDELIDFIDANISGKNPADGTDFEQPRDYWAKRVHTQFIVDGAAWPFDFKITGTPVTNEFTLKDSSGTWCIGDGKSVMAIETTNPTIKNATDDELKALNAYIIKNDPEATKA